MRKKKEEGITIIWKINGDVGTIMAKYTRVEMTRIIKNKEKKRHK